jgi:glycosyltransferase involved in cell wall biosynthesis
MKINIATPVRKGGPYYWGQSLANILNKYNNKNIYASHIYDLKDVLLTPFFQDCDIFHAAIPITYRLWNKPVIFTVHGEYRIEQNLWRGFFPLAMKMADVITVPSAYLMDALDIKNARIIPNAIYIEKYGKAIHSEKKDINVVTMTNFAFMDKSYGIIELLKILSRAAKNTPMKINYTVVGGGEHLEKIKKISREYDVNVKFTGQVSDPEKILEMNDIFIYYSKHDNQPISILEAMATCLPVITNDVGAVNEMIDNGHDGYIARSLEEFESVFNKILDDHKLRENIGNNARQKIENKFSWDKIIHSYINIYEELI